MDWIVSERLSELLRLKPEDFKVKPGFVVFVSLLPVFEPTHGLCSVIEEEMSDELALLMDNLTSKAGTSSSKLCDGEVLERSSSSADTSGGCCS